MGKSETATEKRAEERAELEVRALGWWARIRSKDLKDVYSFVAIICLVVALVWLDNHKEATATNHKVVESSLKEMKEHIAEQTYVLTLSQEKRDALNLQMPDSLRKKLAKNQ
jgi:hypothetical protein